MAISSLPTTIRPNDIPKILKIWQTALNPLISKVSTPKSPWNFKATNARGGIQLSWSPLPNVADGYQILRSATGDFSQPDATYNLPGSGQNSFYDAIPTSASVPTVTKFYKIRATAGTQSKPQTVLGVLSGIVSQTCIATNDTVTVPSTNHDTTTTDHSQSQAGRAPRLNYPHIPSNRQL